MISCIKNDIALYSPHTSFDAVASGVNDWLISPYGKTAHCLCNNQLDELDDVIFINEFLKNSQRLTKLRNRKDFV